MGAIFMTENSSSGTRTRHVDTRWHFVRELVEGKVVEIVFVKSADNVADGFTKNVSTEVHETHAGEYVWDRSEIVASCTDIVQSGRVLNDQSFLVREWEADSHGAGDWTQSVPVDVDLLATGDLEDEADLAYVADLTYVATSFERSMSFERKM
jgi:hypothetical protein